MLTTILILIVWLMIESSWQQTVNPTPDKRYIQNQTSSVERIYWILRGGARPMTVEEILQHYNYLHKDIVDLNATIGKFNYSLSLLEDCGKITSNIGVDGKKYYKIKEMI